MRAARLCRHLFTPDWIVRRAFPASALARIEQAIAESERQHRGQIRFAVEGALHPAAIWRGLSARDRAIEIFSLLRIWDTEHNNGVLLYLLLADREVEIVADRGIAARIFQPEWESVCRDMEKSLVVGRHEAALQDGISAVTRLLARHYPADGSGGTRLPDTPVVIP
jgi:uncharacterized membrane protein